MESKANNTSIKATDQFKLDFLLCPYCKINIPYIAIMRINNEFKAKVFCCCIKTIKYLNLTEFYSMIKSLPLPSNNKCSNNHPDEKEPFYCPNCLKWYCTSCLNSHSQQHLNHSLILNIEVNIICHHNSKYEAYCHQCQINICKECRLDHNNHEVASIAQLDLYRFNNEREKIALIMQTLEKNANEFIEKINIMIQHEFKAKPFENNNSINQCNSKLYYMMTDIKQLYQKTKEVNIMINDIIQIIFNTALTIKDCPNYELAKVVNEFTIDYHELKQTKIKGDLNEYYDNIKQYLNSNIIFNQNSTNSIQTVLSLHKHIVYVLIQLTNGQLASGSGDHTIKIWMRLTFICIETLKGHTHYVSCLIELPNAHLASGSYDNTIRIWNMNSYTCIATLSGHLNAVLCFIFLNNNSRLISGSRDNTIKVWDYNDNSDNYMLNKTLELHNDSITALIEHKNRNCFISSSWDNSIIVWDSISLMPLKSLMKHTDSVTCLLNLNIEDNSHANQGLHHRFASGSNDTTIFIWNINDFSSIQLKGHSNAINYMLQLSNGQLVSVSNKEIKIWNLSTFENIFTISSELSNVINCIAELQNNKLAFSCLDKGISLWDLKMGRFITRIENRQNGIKSMMMVNKCELAVCSFNNITIWTIAD